MSKNFKRLPPVLALGAVVAATSVFTVASRSGAGDAAAPRPVDAAAVAMVSREQAQVQQAGILAAAGRNAIQYVAAARQALTDAQPAQARQHLEAAQEILAHMGKILDSSENYGLDAEGNVGHLVPLYARLGVEEGVTLSDARKRTFGGLAPLVARGDHAAVVEQLRSSGLPMAYSYVALPLEATAAQVARALESLDGDETDRALALVAAAEDTLVSQVITVGMSSEKDESSVGATSASEAATAQTEPAEG